jgi:transposase InsO family protein
MSSVSTAIFNFSLTVLLPHIYWVMAYCCLYLWCFTDDIISPSCYVLSDSWFRPPNPKYSLPSRPTQRIPWKTDSSFPASWMVLSVTMLTMAAASELQISPAMSRSCSVPVKSRSHASRPVSGPTRPIRPLKLWERPIHDWEWDSVSINPTIPAKYLHLSGFGAAFESTLTLKYQAYWAAEDAWSADHPDSDDFVPSTSSTVFDPDVILSTPLFRHRLHVAPHSFNSTQVDTRFIAALTSDTYRDRGTSSSTEDLFPIIFDTGCSFAMTPDLSDFISEPVKGNWGSVTTASGSLPITAFGLVEWHVISNTGDEHKLKVPCHLVEGANQRLFSPQDYARYHNMPTDTATYQGNAASAWFKLALSDNYLGCNVDPRSNIPMLIAARQPKADCSCSGCHSCSVNTAYLSVLAPENANLTGAQKTLLLDHQRLGHINFAHLQALYRPTDTTCHFDGCSKEGEGCLPSRHASVSTCDPPQCLACNAAKARRRPSGAKKTTIRPERENILSLDILRPGQRVSVDQYESSVRGRLPSTRGREKAHQKYCGGTLFIDHASTYIHVENQSSLSATDTIRSKHIFEQQARGCGVEVEHYHTDNGVFTSKKFEEELTAERQSADRSATGAHHQNGNAERAIQTVQNMARAMMLHSSIMWTDEFDQSLWPYALDYSAWLYNHTPRQDSGLAPMEVFCGTKLECRYLRRAKVWGCPAYVLDPRLQDGQKIPKWEPRARRGQFLGFSRRHSSLVGLIRNMNTQYITPQFHVVYDELFTTVTSDQSHDMTETWIDLFKDSRESYIEGHDETTDGPIPALHDHWLTLEEQEQRTKDTERPLRLPDPTLTDDDNSNNSDDDSEQGEDDSHENPPGQGEDDDVDLRHQGEHPRQQGEHPRQLEESVTRPRRNPRRAARDRPHKGKSDPHSVRFHTSGIMEGFRLQASDRRVRFLDADVSELGFFNSIDWDASFNDPQDQYFCHLMNVSTDPISKEIYNQHPLAFATKASAADAPTLYDILKLPAGKDRSDWFDAMDKELDDLMDKGTFTIENRSVAQGHEITPSTWVFKRKRRPDGFIIRYKARFCVRGDRQKETGQSKDDTYAPVVDWATIRLIFNLAVHFNWHTQQIDFKNAFVQSVLPAPIFLELPPGGYSTNYPGKILKVTRSLYGDRRAPRLWYNHLRNFLIDKSGFVTSDIDACLFLKKDLLVIVYVDDAIICSPKKEIVDKFLLALRSNEYDFTEDGDLAAYLGVSILKRDDGSLLLQQKGLTDRIIALLGLNDGTAKFTPAVCPLGKCKNDPPALGEFNYRSAIGMMMYLGNNTRADCTFAINQCARFSSDPRIPHEKAVKRIGRYLLGTRDEGLVIRPNGSLALDTYVDADFAGLWNYEDLQDEDCVRSRSGFLITLGDSPVYWTSKLQTEVATSTMESEYIALSQSMKQLIPLKHVYREIIQHMNLPIDAVSTISTVFEDNNAALILARSTNPPRLTPRSKSIAVKYHWFRSHLSESSIVIQSIGTDLQRANILTKPLTRFKFEHEREMLMGWPPRSVRGRVSRESTQTMRV